MIVSRTRVQYKSRKEALLKRNSVRSNDRFGQQSAAKNCNGFSPSFTTCEFSKWTPRIFVLIRNMLLPSPATVHHRYVRTLPKEPAIGMYKY